VLAENLGILFGIDIAPYIVNQPLKLFFKSKDKWAGLMQV
jgi:hypothetical protein